MNYWQKCLLFLSFFLGLSSSCLAQAITGLPEMLNYTPEDYFAHKQNWQVRQHSNGYLYFANNSGVLEFDGSNWRLISHPNLVHVYDFAWSGNRLLVSGFGSFGYFQQNANLDWQYHDLSNGLPAEAKGQYIYRVLASPKGDFFVGSHFVYRYKNGKLSKVAAKSERFSAIAWVDNQVLLGNVYGNFYHFDVAAGRLNRLETRGEILNTMVLEIKIIHGKAVVVTNVGLYWWRDGELSQFKTETDGWFSEHELRAVTAISDNLLALGSRRDGLAIINTKGEWLHQINQASGLRFDRVTQVAMDDQMGLWATQDGGITRIDMNQGLYRLERPHGLDAVQDFAQGTGKLYAASRSKGVYRYRPATKPGELGRFEQVSGIGAWSLATVNDKVLASDNWGIMEIGETQKDRLLKNQRTVAITKASDDLLYGISESGLVRIRRHLASPWVLETVNQERFLGDNAILVDANRLLVGGLGRSLWLISDLSQWPDIRYERLASELTGLSLRKHRNEALILTDKIGHINWKTKQFEAHPRFKSFNTYITKKRGQVGRELVSHGEKFYMVNDGRLGRFILGEDGQYNWETANVPSLGYQEVNAMAIFQDTLLVAQLNQIFAFPISTLFTETKNPRLSIRELSADSGEIAENDDGYHLNESNGIELTLAVNAFRQADKNRYRYRLNDEPWQDWQNESHINLARLPSGEQRISLQARNSLQQVTPINTIRVHVPRPWYFHPLFWLANVLLLILVVVLVQRSYYQVKNRRLVIRQKELELLVAEKTKHLSELDKVKTDFFCNITHEIRTPLTLNIGNLQYILQKFSLTDAVKEAVSQAVNNSKRLMFLVNQILDINRYAVQPDELKIKTHDLKHFLSFIGERFKLHAVQQDISLVIELPETVVPVNFDPEKMERIVFNLMANAFKFTPAQGRIELKLVAEDKSAVITVTDTGVGIPADYMPRLFDRFFSHSYDSQVSYASSGIGLSIVKSLVERQHGHIEVESQVDEGSRFSVSFPLVEIDRANVVDLSEAELIIDADILPHSQRTTSSSEQQEKVNDKPTLLLVDDNHELRQLLSRIFAEKYNVLEAENGQDGLQVLRRYTPDLVICDVMMPHMNGLELVAIAKGDPETNFIPIFLLTASQNKGNEQKGLLTGADDYLEKPFDMVVLTAKVDNYFKMLANRRARLAQQPQPIEAQAATKTKENAFKQQIERYISEHIGEVDVNDLAKHLKFDSNQLYRRIKKEYDLSPQYLIRELRLRMAASLLKTTKDYVSVIAYEVGFSNLSYFTRCFKEKYGVTPNQYRSG